MSNAAQLHADFASEQGPSSRRLLGIFAVAAFHVALVYALVSGLASDVIEIIKKPLEAKLIVELPPPPPPPPPVPKEIVKAAAPRQEAPPPFVPPPETQTAPSAAPTITSTPEPPQAAYKIEPAPPPAQPPAPRAAPARQEIGVVCPTQVIPEQPAKAIQDGIAGIVKAQVRISGGVVKEVTILSGPRIFHAAVKAAIGQYKCISGADDVTAVQEFEFKLD